MNKLPQLVAMVGISHSGKSTIVRQKYLPQGYAVVCPDQIRLAVHGKKYFAPAEQFVWAIVTVMVDSLLASGCMVVIDATNLTEERRNPWKERGAVFHVLFANPAVCEERARKDGYDEMVPIIHRQNSQYEPVLKNAFYVCPWEAAQHAGLE